MSLVRLAYPYWLSDLYHGYLTDLQEGPIVWAPLSEEFGRRFIMMATFAIFTLFTLSCAVAPNWSSFLVFRLFTGIFGSSPVALGPGILADIYQHARVRGWGIATFMAVRTLAFLRYCLFIYF